MRISTALLLLPALTLADQIPLGDQLKGWFEKAKSFIPNQITSPLDSGAAKVASENVVYLTKDNWSGEIAKGVTKTPHEWMILVSGGNKTCWGQCDQAEKAWQESAVILSADPTGPSLGYLNCDEQAILCSIWAAGPPAIYHFYFPATSAEGGKPKTPFHVININSTSVTAKDIIEIHTKKTWQDVPAYEGVFHPYDGILSQFGLNIVVGYIIWVFGVVPSWMLMIGISFLSRSFMSGRAANPNPAAGRTAPVGQPAAAQ